MADWYVYMLRCADGSLYTGVTTDLDRRVKEHNHGLASRGAKYTRVRQPVSLVYSEALASRSLACKREWEIKQLRKTEKEILVGQSESQYSMRK